MLPLFASAHNGEWLLAKLTIPASGEVSLTVTVDAEANFLIKDPAALAREAKELLLLNDGKETRPWSEVAPAPTFGTADRLDHARACLKRLDPNPGRELVPPESTAIIPDVIVEYDPESGDYTARLADELMPRVRVSPDYEAMMKDIELDTKARSFVTESVRAARSIIEAIELEYRSLT